MSNELERKRLEAIIACRRFLVVCCTNDYRWSDKILQNDYYQREMAKIAEADVDSLQRMIDGYNRDIKATSEYIKADEGITPDFSGIPAVVSEPPRAEPRRSGWSRWSQKQHQSQQSDPTPTPSQYQNPNLSRNRSPKPRPKMPTGFSDKFSNIYELLSEKRAEVRGQDSQLKIKERRLERDKRKLDLEFENSRLDALGSVDTTAYETTLAKVEAERSEIDAWLTELNFAIRVISTAEARIKDLCIRLPRILALLNERGQSLAEETDPNVFYRGGPKKDRAPEFQKLLTEYEEAIDLLSCRTNTPLAKPTEKKSLSIPDFGERIETPTQKTHGWLTKLCLPLNSKSPNWKRKRIR